MGTAPAELNAVTARPFRNVRRPIPWFDIFCSPFAGSQHIPLGAKAGAILHPFFAESVSAFGAASCIRRLSAYSPNNSSERSFILDGGFVRSLWPEQGLMR
jgi:hypothetical protein